MGGVPHTYTNIYSTHKHTYHIDFFAKIKFYFTLMETVKKKMTFSHITAQEFNGKYLTPNKILLMV